MRVVVADDSLLTREGIVHVLRDAGLDVVAEAGDADGLLRAVQSSQPDVAVVDIKMPPTHTDEGLRAAQQIRDEHLTLACWCCRSTSNRATRCGSSRLIRNRSDTCSRSACSRRPCSSTQFAASTRARRSSTRPSCRRCSDAAGVRTRWRSSAPRARGARPRRRRPLQQGHRRAPVRRRAHRRSPRHADLPQAAPRRRPDVTPPSAGRAGVPAGVTDVEGSVAGSHCDTPLSTIGYMSSRRYIEGDLPDDGTVLDAFVKLLVAEPDEKDRDGLDGLVRRSLRVRGWLDAVDARIAVAAAPAGCRGRRGEAPATVLAGGGRRARRDAEAAAARGSVCARMPAVAVRRWPTARSVPAMSMPSSTPPDTSTTTEPRRLAEHSQALVNAAASMTPEEFDREVGDLARYAQR